MLNSKPALRKLLILISLAMFTCSAPRMAMAVDAGEILMGAPVLDDLRDGDVKIVQIGQSNVGVHLLVQDPGHSIGSGLNSNPAIQSAILPDVFLSLRMPW